MAQSSARQVDPLRLRVAAVSDLGPLIGFMSGDVQREDTLLLQSILSSSDDMQQASFSVFRRYV